MSLESLSSCPICKSTVFSPFLTCNDHTTSNESFNLQQCTNCLFVFTSPRPDRTSLPKYYESEKYISHTSQSSGIVDSIYLLARKFTLRWKKNIIQKYSTHKGTLLDYGCGTGDFLRTCSAGGWKAYGIEPSGSANAKASVKTVSPITVLKAIDLLPPVKFEAITLWHVLEHVEDLELKIDQLKNLLSENGTLFVAVPNRASYDQQVYREKWAAYDVPRHLWHFTINDMTTLTAQAGLSIKEIKPMKLDAYYISLLSQKYRSGGFTITGALNALRIALLSNLKARNNNNYSSLIYIIKK